MQNSEHLPMLEEDDPIPLKLEQIHQRISEKENPSNSSKAKPETSTETPIRSNRLAAQKQEGCSLDCCISLLFLLLAAGQTSALEPTPPDPSISSHTGFNLSENQKLQTKVRNYTDRT